VVSGRGRFWHPRQQRPNKYLQQSKKYLFGIIQNHSIQVLAHYSSSLMAECWWPLASSTAATCAGHMAPGRCQCIHSLPQRCKVAERINLFGQQTTLIHQSQERTVKHNRFWLLLQKDWVSKISTVTRYTYYVTVIINIL